jgi:hypothetical protein
VSSTPSPGASNLHLSAGKDPPEALLADIAEGFYVTDLIGMGVNQVTRLQRGAPDLDQERQAWLPREITIAGLVGIFNYSLRTISIPLRHQCADRAREGLTVRPVIPQRSRQMCAIVSPRGARRRRARAADIRGQIKSWLKDGTSPVSGPSRRRWGAAASRCGMAVRRPRTIRRG